MCAGISSGPSLSCSNDGSPSGARFGGEVFQIVANGRIGVLADDQRGARVVNENVAETLDDLRSLDGLLDLSRELVRSAPAGLDRQMLSVDHRSRTYRNLPVISTPTEHKAHYRTL